MKLDDYRARLEEEIGTIVGVQECCPSLYLVEADDGGVFHKEYYVLFDDGNAPFSGQVWKYGWLFGELHLVEVGRYGSGWEVVQYEITRYNLAAGKETVSEETFHDRALQAMDAYIEYFGFYPVPYHTPEGYTLRYHDLANGIYWLETSRGKDLLAISAPIWNTELSDTAIALGKMTEQDRIAGASKSLCYLFFSKEDSCVPFYELAVERPVWAGACIHTPALMNALWIYAPEYARHLNGGKTDLAAPQPDGKHVIGMYPEEGTEFLRLR